MAEWDVIIIGSGAGGGTLARHLAPSGKQILLLERGDWLPREPPNWLAGDVFVENRYVSPDTWTDSDNKPFQPQVHYFVGGATKLYGAALYRMRKEDFGEVRHHGGISPAWPISYEEMEPYYTRAEQLYQVHGARGEDPTEPPASAPYPFPAGLARAAHPAALRRLAAAGLHPFHAPCGDPAQRGQHALQRMRALLHLRWVSLRRPRQIRRRGARRAAGSRVSERHAADEREARQSCERRNRPARHRSRRRTQRQRETFSALHRRCLVWRGEQRQAPARLSQATSTRNGLANGSDQVGRNYMYHNSQAVLALSREPNPTVFQKTLGVNDFYFGSDGVRIPDGQHPDGRQVAGADVSVVRSPWRPRLRRHGRCATSPDTPSTSGFRPRICRRRRTASPWTTMGTSRSATGRPTTRPGSGCTRS